MTQLKQQINAEAYRIADSINTSSSWNHFISTFTTSPMLAVATEKRNTVAFNEALRKNDYSSYAEFLKSTTPQDEANNSAALDKYNYAAKKRSDAAR